MASRVTGLVGLAAVPNAREVLAGLCRNVLSQVRVDIPESAGYRKLVVSTYQQRLSACEQHEKVEDIEKAVGTGVIEEFIEEAKDELDLISKMKEWKPWEVPANEDTLGHDAMKKL